MSPDTSQIVHLRSLWPLFAENKTPGGSRAQANHAVRNKGPLFSENKPPGGSFSQANHACKKRVFFPENEPPEGASHRLVYFFENKILWAPRKKNETGLR